MTSKIIRLGLIAIFINGCASRTSTTVSGPKAFASSWHSDEPWINVSFQGDTGATWTMAFGTVCQSDIIKTDTEITVTNSIAVLTQPGDSPCSLFDTVYEYHFQPGRLELLQPSVPGTDWIEFR